METKASNETFTESAKLASKSVNDLSSAMIEIYKKQLNTVFDFYNNLFDSTMGVANKNTWDPASGFSSPFLKNNGAFKSVPNPLAWLKPDGDNSNPFMTMNGNLFGQLNEYNKSWINSLQKNNTLEQIDWSAINEKYQKTRESHLETIKNIADTFTNAYNKQLDFSIESNKNLFAELNKQFTTALKINEDFWKNIVKTYGAPIKEGNMASSKKPEKKETVTQ